MLNTSWNSFTLCLKRLRSLFTRRY